MTILFARPELQLNLGKELRFPSKSKRDQRDLEPQVFFPNGILTMKQRWRGWTEGEPAAAFTNTLAKMATRKVDAIALGQPEIDSNGRHSCQ